ncbi:MAG: glycogen debranching protein GlgX [Litorimonas sp.]
MTDWPLGAVPTESGTHFSLFSAHATAVTLCLFEGNTETDRIALTRAGVIWSVHVPEVYVGQAYGYRVDGPYAPSDGHRFNAYKLLIDPYAKALRGSVIEHPSLYGHLGDDDLSFNNLDSAAYVPKAIVTAPNARRDWRRPGTDWCDTLLYEAHVKGLTQRHPAVKPALRGTVEGLANPALIDHLTALGVTALELLPLQKFHSEPRLTEMGLSNYWGYNPINYFTPHAAYLGPQGEDGLRQSVRALHKAGIEVILDVVYNHTAESWHLGPTLSFKGIDNASYYALQDDRRFYVNHTGTGNMLDMRCAAVRDLTLASLRHWVTDYGVDGFRFDLAPTLGRMGHGFDASAPMLEAIADDPVLSSVKLIAEPWDIGPHGYQLGQFPNGWVEWNDEYRDALRSFWHGDERAHQTLAGKLLGSSERFDHNSRPAWSSVNFLAAHDGFTLHDTVSFHDKHNMANGEDNRDGHGHNLSDNMGIEGPTDDPQTLARRRDRKIAMLATLLLSQGTPMLLAGDEFGQSQNGNNNAYCQDNETTWLNWDAADPDLIQTVQALTALRRHYPHFRQSQFLHGHHTEKSALPDAQWITPDGQPMSVTDWEQEGRAGLGLALAMPDEPTVAVFFNRGAHTRITLSEAWTPVFGTRDLTGDAVAVFELPVTDVPEWEREARVTDHANASGLHEGFHDIAGHWHAMTDATRDAILTALDVDLTTPPIQTQDNGQPIATIFGAKQLKTMKALGGGVWGVTTALYALHSKTSWGIGDFETLAQLAEGLAPTGCDFIGINPVHALFPGAPHLFAPYSVSSRDFLNVMHIAPDQLPEWAGSRPDFKDGEFVDYAAVYAAKSAAFETAFTAFQSLPKTHPRHIAFAAYKDDCGVPLVQHALYNVLFDRLPTDQQTYAGWKNFAPECHDPESAASRAMAQQHADRIDYYIYLQWNAELQLADAQARAKAAGMRIGLYLDLAVGVVPGGSDVWRNQDAFARDMSLGAPGDAANPDGQRWNLLPLRPDRFGDAQAADHAFRAALRAVMTHAGAVRIDHVLGLSRSFWIPEDAPGGYVTYPFTRLMQIISEESHTASCIIFGEDLGTVPNGFRDQMAAHDLLGCSVQMIERGHHGEMLPRENTRTLAMNAWSNHDFPTVSGFWNERDLVWREQLNIGVDSLAWEREQRACDRQAMADMIGLADTLPTLTAAHMSALQAYLAAGPSLAFAVQMDDLLLSEDQPNVPGTTSEQPNWRRRTPLSVEGLLTDPDAQTILNAIADARSSQR